MVRPRGALPVPLPPLPAPGPSVAGGEGRDPPDAAAAAAIGGPSGARPLQGEALPGSPPAAVGEICGGDPEPGQERGPGVAGHLRDGGGGRPRLRPRRLPHARLPRPPQLPPPHRLRRLRPAPCQAHIPGTPQRGLLPDIVVVLHHLLLFVLLHLLLFLLGHPADGDLGGVLDDEGPVAAEEELQERPRRNLWEISAEGHGALAKISTEEPQRMRRRSRSRHLQDPIRVIKAAMEVDSGPLSPVKPPYSSKGKAVAATVPPDSKSAPWVEKYRPQSLADVAAHRDIIDTIDRLTNENRLPHLLLYGPPGTGKTSTILAVARKLYGAQYHNMILELNASDDRGIDVVRQQIQDFASTRSFDAKCSVKLVLLDEADAMTKDAQFALRRVIEKYTRSTRFTLICNHVNKIIPALQSRCTRFRFAPLDATHVTERIQYIIQAEGIDVSESGLAAVVRLSSGDMRKALNILQSTHMASQHVTEEAVYLCTGNPLPKDIEQIALWLLNDPFTDDISETKMRKGLALVDIVREVTMFMFKIKMPSDVRVQMVNDLADIEYVFLAFLITSAS
ncbi:hypothetical protein Taro_009275 [Colocasia esculenta]|uniref:AAA+ ATPase domain-containing protein n=1 Tax=Colocasia esculenta TaxID=4460 RepID=A0A843U9I1_COLES|nr:hypothetical protein [Colocasia esculenta]